MIRGSGLARQGFRTVNVPLFDPLLSHLTSFKPHWTTFRGVLLRWSSVIFSGVICLIVWWYDIELSNGQMVSGSILGSGGFCSSSEVWNVWTGSQQSVLDFLDEYLVIVYQVVCYKSPSQSTPPIRKYRDKLKMLSAAIHIQVMCSCCSSTWFVISWLAAGDSTSLDCLSLTTSQSWLAYVAISDEQQL